MGIELIVLESQEEFKSSTAGERAGWAVVVPVCWRLQGGQTTG